MSDLFHTYSTPDIVPVALTLVILAMAMFWPERKPPARDPRAEQRRARQQMDDATRETVRRMREAANDPDNGDTWRL